MYNTNFCRNFALIGLACLAIANAPPVSSAEPRPDSKMNRLSVAPMPMRLSLDGVNKNDYASHGGLVSTIMQSVSDRNERLRAAKNIGRIRTALPSFALEDEVALAFRCGEQNAMCATIEPLPTGESNDARDVGLKDFLKERGWSSLRILSISFEMRPKRLTTRGVIVQVVLEADDTVSLSEPTRVAYLSYAPATANTKSKARTGASDTAGAIAAPWLVGTPSLLELEIRRALPELHEMLELAVSRGANNDAATFNAYEVPLPWLKTFKAQGVTCSGLFYCNNGVAKLTDDRVWVWDSLTGRTDGMGRYYGILIMELQSRLRAEPR